MIKKFFVYAILVLVLSIIVLFGKGSNIDYWDILGIKDSYSYSEIVTNKGAPKNIKHEDDGSYICYDGVSFFFPNKDLNGIFIRAEVTNDSVKFGKCKVSVGDYIDSVYKQYNKKKRINDLDKDKLGFIDGDVWVYFYFNQLKKVEKIVITRGI